MSLLEHYKIKEKHVHVELGSECQLVEGVIPMGVTEIQLVEGATEMHLEVILIVTAVIEVQHAVNPNEE